MYGASSINKTIKRVDGALDQDQKYNYALNLDI